jgi:hypothetical protein
MAKGGGAEIGATKRGKGMKIMAIVDRHGLPLSVSTHAANHHEVRLVQLCFDFYMIEAKPENLIGDRAYDSDPLDEELRRDGIEMIALHRTNRSKPPTQDRRRLTRYMRRWLVERFFAWIPSSAGSTIPRISWALFNSPASLSSSGDFEIGSSHAAHRNRASLALTLIATRTKNKSPFLLIDCRCGGETSLREWAYAQAYSNSTRAKDRAPDLAASATTGIRHTPASMIKPPSADSA